MSQSGQPKVVAPTSVMCIAAALETQSGEAVHSNAIFFVNLSFQLGMVATCSVCMQIHTVAHERRQLE